MLVFVHSLTYVRFLDPVVRAWLEGGDQVHLVVERADHDPQEADWLHEVAVSPGFSSSVTNAIRYDRWRPVAGPLRRTHDYIRFLTPAFSRAPYLVQRARGRAPGAVVRLLEFRLLRSPGVLRTLIRVAAALEAALPPNAELVRLLRSGRPDVVVLFPHLMPGARHSEVIRAARKLGIPTCVAVASWDNLSSKQFLHELPELVVVWNETQRREAVGIHRVPPERVVVTGAQNFDVWFDWRPRPREFFCRMLGIPAERPYVLYLGGSLFPGEVTEAEFALRWIEALRAARDPVVRRAGVVVRPHPKRAEEWRDARLDELEDVVVWPPHNDEMPVARDARADFFDSIFHSAAVVGLNTSAMIEAAIVGRTVHTVLVPEFASSQRDVFHFDYLLREAGGLVRSANGLAEHVEQLAETLHGVGARDEAARRRTFLEAFVRPHGLDRPATPLFLDAVERAASLDPVAAQRLPSRLPLMAVLFLARLVAPGVHAAARGRHKVARALRKAIRKSRRTERRVVRSIARRLRRSVGRTRKRLRPFRKALNRLRRQAAKRARLRAIRKALNRLRRQGAKRARRIRKALTFERPRALPVVTTGEPEPGGGRILFSALSPRTVMNFETVVRELASRGHHVDLLVHEGIQSPPAQALLRSLGDEPRVRVLGAEFSDADLGVRVALRIRALLDYLQFLDERFHESYRARAEKRLPFLSRRLMQSGLVKSRTARKLLTAALRRLDRAQRPSRALVAYIGRLGPDVALFSPYIGLRTIQPDFLRAARARGVPTAVCVASWDNLTSKSTISPTPDRVFVWNETQRCEAVELHGVPGERVVVTGAQCYDEWLTWQPRPRDEFCRRVGLDPERPYVLYTCFTPFKGSQHEVDFVLRWVRHLRASSDPLVGGVGVLVRPHPKRTVVWADVDADGLENLAVFPRSPGWPVDPVSKADYFDSIYHSAAVVGINTSAMLEAGALGRPVLTIFAPEFWESQAGTLHFRYLVETEGGLVHGANDLEEHERQLGEALRGAGEEWASEARRFVRAFLRPHGLDAAATPVFVDAVEDLAGRHVPSARRSATLRQVAVPAGVPSTTHHAAEGDEHTS